MTEPSFRATMSRFATCVMVTTTVGPTGPVGCTTTAVVSLSVRPPTMLVSLSSASRTLAAIYDTGWFAVNVLSTAQRDLVDRFSTAALTHRFDGVPHTFWGGVPLLDGAAAAVVCRLRQSVQLLDHTLVAGTARHTRTHLDEPLVLLDGRSHTPMAIDTEAIV